jgi:molybdopterin molybdotransferase
LMFGKLGDLPVVSMPGNPVSALVCALLFLRPAMAKMLGHASTDLVFEKVKLSAPLPANDKREDYLRSQLQIDSGGRLTVSAAKTQDSSMLMTLTKADALIRRMPFAPPAQAGDEVDVLRLDPLNTL